MSRVISDERLLHRERQRGLGRGGVQHGETLGLELQADQVRGFEVVFHDQRGARSRQPLIRRAAGTVGRRQHPFLRQPGAAATP